jgi:hypothetical protein
MGGGFGAESDGSSNSPTYDATTDLTFLTATTEELFLNLTSGEGTLPAGDTFSLVFGYNINGDGWVDSPTFTTLAAADAYFNAMAIDLGSFGAGTQTLDLSYQFAAMGDPPSYMMTYHIAGTSVTPTIPDPRPAYRQVKPLTLLHLLKTSSTSPTPTTTQAR